MFLQTSQRSFFGEELRANQQYSAGHGLHSRSAGTGQSGEKCCRTCEHGRLMRHEKNPLISQCELDGERQVANYYYCKEYKFTNEEKTIESI